MYKTYNLKLNDALLTRSSTDGYQPKFVVDNGKSFIKVQCRLSGVYIDDWKVEYLASKIGYHLGFNILKQEPCHVNLNTGHGILKLYGVKSKNFENDGYSYVSFRRLLDKFNISLTRDIKYPQMSNVSKILYISSIVSKYLKMDERCMVRYLLQLAIVDVFVGNIDRHIGNFGFIIKDGVIKTSPIFDSGLGLFVYDTSSPSLSFDDCYNRVYIEPYSEDPIKLLNDLDCYFGVKTKLRDRVLTLNLGRSYFMSDNAYEYYKRIRREFLRQ